MDLASLVICGVENGTIGCQLAVLSVDLAFVMPHHPHFYLVGMLVVLNMPMKSYLKWWAIWLPSHSTVGA